MANTQRPPLPSQLALLTLSFSILRYRIHVINVHNVLGPGSLAHSLAGIFKNIPVIGTPHGDDIQKLPEIGYGVNLDPKAEKMLRRNLEFFTFVTAISNSMRKNLSELLFGDRKIRNVPNGVWFSNFQKPINKAEVRAQYCIPKDSIALISIGRNHPVKSFKTSIEALARLGNITPKISFILVGRDMESLVQRAHAIGVSQSVITPGEVRRSEVARLLQASDIYISSSLMESFSLTTLEAMCAGLPSIVSNVNGNKDLVSPESAMLFTAGNTQELADAIMRLARDSELRKEMGIKASVEALKYDWRGVVNIYLDVYREAIVKAGGHSSRYIGRF